MGKVVAFLGSKFFVWICFHVILTSAHKINVIPVDGNRTMRFLPLTFVTHESEGLRRLERSSEAYGVLFNVLQADPPGEVNTLMCSMVLQFGKLVEGYKDEEDTIIMLIDGFDMMFTAGPKEVVKRFMGFDANILFGTEVTSCFPNIGLQYLYTEKEDGYRCLNSGLIIGYAPYLHKLLQNKVKTGTFCDDQVHFTRLYMIPEVQESLNIKLDYRANFVQNLCNLPDSEYKLVLKDDDAEFVNVRFGSRPVLLHGHSFGGKVMINNVGNYVAQSWTKRDGCAVCRQRRIQLENRKESEYPSVLLGVFVERGTPFLKEMLRKVSDLIYPKKRIFLYVYNKVAQHEELIIEWMNAHKQEYLSANFTSSIESLSNPDAKHLALLIESMWDLLAQLTFLQSKPDEGGWISPNKYSEYREMCIQVSCDLFFNVESEAHLDNPNTLHLLVSYNRSILAPVMSRHDAYLSTFWGSLAGLGTYKRTFDYIDIVKRTRLGIWNVAHVSGAYVIWRHAFQNQQRFGYHKIYINTPQDYDAIFAYNNKLKGRFMYAVNYENYGHLINTDNVDPNKLENDLWHFKTNRHDWEAKYRHSKYKQALQDSFSTQEVCTKTYRFPLFNERFSEDLEDLVSQARKNHATEDFNSNTQHDIDINKLEEVGYKEEWLDILQSYLKPFANIINECNKETENVWTNQISDQPTNFMIRIALKNRDQCATRIIPNKECSEMPGENVGWATLHPQNLMQEAQFSKCDRHYLLSPMHLIQGGTDKVAA